MAKKGMKRPSGNVSTESNKKNHTSKNDVTPVPEIQGKEQN